MDIVLSGNTAFCKWLGLDLPRIQSTEGKGLGVQKLTTGLARVCWQCHAIKCKGTDANVRNVILVEAYSRYVIILPNMKPVSQFDFEDALLQRWGNELMGQLLEHHVITEAEAAIMVLEFQKTEFKFHWVQNTDMSVNGHVSDAEMWLRADEDRYMYKGMTEDEAFSLGMHINQMKKKVSVSQRPKRYERFFPIERFLNDFMLRFSNREIVCPYPLVYLGIFPSPYQFAISKAELIKRNKGKEMLKKTAQLKSHGVDNIISLDMARIRKNKQK